LVVSFAVFTGKDVDMNREPHVSPGEPAGSGLPPVSTPEIDSHLPAEQVQDVKFTRAAALWSSLILGFLILIVLLIFITQNTASTEFAFLSWHWRLPLGVAILLAAVCGGLLTALVSAARMFQLRRAAKKNLQFALNR
jgi:uncharacterized integral membrane protein